MLTIKHGIYWYETWVIFWGISICVVKFYWSLAFIDSVSAELFLQFVNIWFFFFCLQSSFDRPDEEVAKETLANHIRCNNSFVHALFQAQFRSSLTCLNCQRQSNTFDPFLCVSVPIPQNQKRPIYVIVLYISQQPRQVSND